MQQGEGREVEEYTAGDRSGYRSMQLSFLPSPVPWGECYILGSTFRYLKIFKQSHCHQLKTTATIQPRNIAQTFIKGAVPFPGKGDEQS